MARNARNRYARHRQARILVPPSPSTQVVAAVVNNEKKHDSMEDRISELPDHILVTILSLLSLREAASTHLLSKRWINLWTYVSNLSFETTYFTDAAKRKDPAVRRSEFVSLVNRIIHLHQGNKLDGFRISSCLSDRSGTSYRGDIDNWVDFAFKRSVQKFYLDIDADMSCGNQRYPFPDKVLTYLKTPLGLSCIKTLTNLALHHVDVTDEVVTHFLSNCPFLERLCIRCAYRIKYINAASSLPLRLKFLDILTCPKLQSVGNFCSKFGLLQFLGCAYGPKFIIKEARSLLHLYIAECLASVTYTFCSFSSYFSQLQTLTLRSVSEYDVIGISIPEFPEFTHLQDLTLISQVTEDYHSLLDWTCLIQKAPSLHRFTLQIQWIVNHRQQREIRKAPKCPHQGLKVVELHGFIGCAIDTEFAMYLIENAMALDKIVIDRRRRDFRGDLYPKKETKKRIKAAKVCALQLQAHLPPGAMMEII